MSCMCQHERSRRLSLSTHLGRRLGAPPRWAPAQTGTWPRAHNRPGPHRSPCASRPGPGIGTGTGAGAGKQYNTYMRHTRPGEKCEVGEHTRRRQRGAASSSRSHRHTDTHARARTHLATALSAAVSAGRMVAPVQLHANDAVVQARPVQEGHGVQRALVLEVPGGWGGGGWTRTSDEDEDEATRAVPPIELGCDRALSQQRRQDVAPPPFQQPPVARLIRSPPQLIALHSLDKAEAARLLGEAVEAHDDALDGAHLRSCVRACVRAHSDI
jgi:hypothetical protein